MPKNKAAFSLSSHLGLDWSFRTTASPVIVPRYFEGSSRVISTSSFDVSVHLYIVFVEPNGSSYFEYSSRIISTSRSIPRFISTSRSSSPTVRVTPSFRLGLPLHSGLISNHFEFLRMRELGRPRLRSSDATRFSNNQSENRLFSNSQPA